MVVVGNAGAAAVVALRAGECGETTQGVNRRRMGHLALPGTPAPQPLIDIDIEPPVAAIDPGLRTL